MRLVLILLGSSLPILAQAQTPTPLPSAPFLAQRYDYTVHYGVYSGGFKALKISIHYQFLQDQYRLEMKAKPAGVLGYLLPWAGHYQTKGLIRQGQMIPQMHEKQSAWREDQSHLRLTYDSKGQLIAQTQDNSDVPLDPLLHQGTVDLPTAILHMLVQAHDQNKTAKDIQTFDGRRRFRMVFTDRGSVRLTPTKYNVASGMMLKSQLELIPVAGFKGKPRGYYMIQEQARARGALPMVWVGALWPKGPFGAVKMLVKSDYGSVFIHLEKIDNHIIK
jgi:hypothetical protein